MKKIIGIFCGGNTPEHSVSLKSAKTIYENLDPKYFAGKLLGLTKTNQLYLLNPNDMIEALSEDSELVLDQKESLLVNLSSFEEQMNQIDFAFSMIHGKHGEDGSLQGLFEIFNMPYAGCGVLASSICMDKAFSKSFLESTQILQPKFVVITNRKELKEKLGSINLTLPLFVKPANAGSSVGITKVTSIANLDQAVEYAFNFDDKVVVEEFVEGMEIECAVKGNAVLQTSMPSQILSTHEFYDYSAKYIDPYGASFQVPAKLDPILTLKVQSTAKMVYKLMGCEGFARVDCFIDNNQQVYVSEINTLPGFTPISMFPKMWEVSGLRITHLITELITLGFERYEKRKKLLNSPTQEASRL